LCGFWPGFDGLDPRHLLDGAGLGRQHGEMGEEAAKRGRQAQRPPPAAQAGLLQKFRRSGDDQQIEGHRGGTVLVPR
jgi:hypothetical protein